VRQLSTHPLGVWKKHEYLIRNITNYTFNLIRSHCFVCSVGRCAWILLRSGRVQHHRRTTSNMIDMNKVWVSMEFICFFNGTMEYRSLIKGNSNSLASFRWYWNWSSNRITGTDFQGTIRLRADMLFSIKNPPRFANGQKLVILEKALHFRSS